MHKRQRKRERGEREKGGASERARETARGGGSTGARHLAVAACLCTNTQKRGGERTFQKSVTIPRYAVRATPAFSSSMRPRRFAMARKLSNIIYIIFFFIQRYGVRANPAIFVVRETQAICYAPEAFVFYNYYVLLSIINCVFQILHVVIRYAPEAEAVVVLCFCSLSLSLALARSRSLSLSLALARSRALARARSRALPLSLSTAIHLQASKNN
jgi:hypothetical protein